MDSVELLTRQCIHLESEVIEQQQQLDLIFRNVPDIIYLLDKFGNILLISDAIRQYGYSPLELQGQSILEIIHPEDKIRAIHRINERRQGDRKTMDFQVRFVTQNQKSISIEVRSAKVEDQPLFMVTAEGYYSKQNRMSFQGTVGIARDITQMKRAFEHSFSPPTKKIHKYYPICANCKNIRDKQNLWVPPEVFFNRELGFDFTHGICPICAQILYPDLNLDNLV